MAPGKKRSSPGKKRSDPIPAVVPLDVNAIPRISYYLDEYEDGRFVCHQRYRAVILDLRSQRRKRKGIRRATSKKETAPVLGPTDFVRVAVYSKGRLITYFIRLFDFYMIAFQKEDGKIWEFYSKLEYLRHANVNTKMISVGVSYKNLSEIKMGRGVLEEAFEIIYSKNPEELTVINSDTFVMAVQSFFVMICEAVRSRICYRSVSALLKEEDNFMTEKITEQMEYAILNWANRSKLARRPFDEHLFFPQDIPQGVKAHITRGEYHEVLENRMYERYAPYYARIEVCYHCIARRKKGSLDEDD